MGGSLVVSDRRGARRAVPQEETGPTASTSNLGENPHHHHKSLQQLRTIHRKASLHVRTLIFLWLQVLRLPRPRPIQLSSHDDGDVVVLLLRPDGVHHWRKAHIHQTHACFLEHLSASALLPRLPLSDTNCWCHIHQLSSLFGQFTALRGEKNQGIYLSRLLLGKLLKWLRLCLPYTKLRSKNVSFCYLSPLLWFPLGKMTKS